MSFTGRGAYSRQIGGSYQNEHTIAVLRLSAEESKNYTSRDYSKSSNTHDRFWDSVIYVDDISDFIYNYLVKGISSKETLESKLSYERVRLLYGRKVKGYHVDNLRFNYSNFKGSCIKGGHKLTFCGVGAHRQNGIVKAKKLCVMGHAHYCYTLNENGRKLYPPSYGHTPVKQK